MEEEKNLEILYRAQTEDDISELCHALLYARDITRMAEAVIQAPDNYYQLKTAFEVIRLLLEPAITFLNFDAIDLVKAYGKKPRKHGA